MRPEPTQQERATRNKTTTTINNKKKNWNHSVNSLSRVAWSSAEAAIDSTPCRWLFTPTKQQQPQEKKNQIITTIKRKWERKKTDRQKDPAMNSHPETKRPRSGQPTITNMKQPIPISSLSVFFLLLLSFFFILFYFFCLGFISLLSSLFSLLSFVLLLSFLL